MNISLVPSAMLGVAGVIAMDTNVADVTVSRALPATEPQVLAAVQVALIVALPGPTALASPLLLTVATAVLEEAQVRSAVRF